MINPEAVLLAWESKTKAADAARVDQAACSCVSLCVQPLSRVFGRKNLLVVLSWPQLRGNAPPHSTSMIKEPGERLYMQDDEFP